MNQCCNVINNLTWHLSMLKQRKIFIQWNERDCIRATKHLQNILYMYKTRKSHCSAMIPKPQHQHRSTARHANSSPLEILLIIPSTANTHTHRAILSWNLPLQSTPAFRSPKSTEKRRRTFNSANGRLRWQKLNVYCTQAAAEREPRVLTCGVCRAFPFFPLLLSTSFSRAHFCHSSRQMGGRVSGFGGRACARVRVRVLEGSVDLIEKTFSGFCAHAAGKCVWFELQSHWKVVVDERMRWGWYF